MALLSRTAEAIYWIGRYVERADNMARLLESGKRMSAVPQADDQPPPWEAILAAAGVFDGFRQRYAVVDQRNTVDYMTFSQENPSSIRSSISVARANARSIRTALTIDMWEALNELYHALNKMAPLEPGDGRLQPFLDLVKGQCALIRGVISSTLLRNDGFSFLCLGMFIERADCTARLLDVEYFAMVGEGDAVDTYHWAVILRATSSLRAYNWEYGGGYDPDNMVDFLVFSTRSPRSLAFCVENITEHLNRLARLYSARHDCHEICGAIEGELVAADAASVREAGLHDFLTRFIARNNWLSTQIARDYHFMSAVLTGDNDEPDQASARQAAS